MRKCREATAEDSHEIARISVESWRHAYSGIMPDSTLSALDVGDRAKKRTKLLQQTSLSTYIFFEGEQAVGFVDFELCRDDDCAKHVGEIWAIYVLPEAREKVLAEHYFA